MDGTVEVHIKQSVLIVPDSCGRVGYLEPHKPNTIVSGIGFDLVHDRSRTRPKLDSRLHTHGAGNRCKVKIRGAAADSELTIGEIVKHVALVGMRLAPGVFMRSNIGGFANIGRARILCCVQVSHVNQDTVGNAIVIVAGVIVSVRREYSGERIHPSARTDQVLVTIKT